MNADGLGHRQLRKVALLAQCWGRKLSETDADNTKTTWAYRQCVDSCANGAVTVEVTQQWARVGGVDQRTSVPGEVFHDRLGRKVLTRSWAADGQPTYADRVFDARGRLQQASRVHSLSERNAGNLVWTTLASDDLGRPTQVDAVKAGGSGYDTTNFEYHGLTTVRIRPWREGLSQRQSRTELRNGLGKLKRVTDEAGKATTYAYEPFGNLVRTTDPLGNQINVQYDRLGRKTQLQDPDLGTVTYQVDPLGQTWRQVDAKNQATTFSFDELGRLVQRVEVDATSSWVYDSAAGGIGQLAETYTGPSTAKDVRRVHAYDSLGRERQATVSFAGEWDYASTTAYDAFGRAARQDHSRNTIGGTGGPSVSFALSYNNQGSVSRVERVAGASVQPLWALAVQDAEGRITEEDLLLNGQKTLRNFNRYTGRLETIRTGLGNGPGNLLDANTQYDVYVHDEVGNAKQRHQLGSSGGLSESFTYDVLDRMVSAQVGGQPQKAFSYDDIGNIVAKADVGIYSYLPSGAGSVRPHAVSQISGTVAGITNPGFSYDANGNLLNGLGRAYGWNAANLPLRIDKLSSGAAVERTEFVYGSNRERAQQLVRPVSAGVPGSPSRIVRYAGAIEKEIDYAQNKTTIRTALPLNLGFYEQVVNDTANVPTATPAQAMQRYYHSDAQGSLNVVTDDSGTVLQRMNYDAWGRRRNVNGSDDAWTSLGSPGLWNAYGDRGYTGHDQIDQLGLVHMIGRVYDPIVGRMTSADPTVPDATDVQAFNRYSYVLNNALKYVDPTGFEPEDPDANPHVHTGDQKKFLFTGSRIARETAPPGTKGVGAGDPVAAKGEVADGPGRDDIVRSAWASSPNRSVAQMAPCVGHEGACAAAAAAPLAGGWFGGTALGRYMLAAFGLASAPNSDVPLPLGGGVAAMEAKAAAKGLPDAALVCRGGLCTADRFAAGSGVKIDAAGKMSGASVNSAADKTVQALSATIPNPKVGVTTVGDIRRAGGDVVPKPTPNNPFHCEMCGITPQQAERLFTPVIPNPNR